MTEETDQAPRKLGDDRRAEREFDVITFILAGVLAAIVLAAVGYGIFRSSEIATTIPFPTAGSQIAVKGATPATTEGSGAGRQKGSVSP